MKTFRDYLEDALQDLDIQDKGQIKIRGEIFPSPVTGNINVNTPIENLTSELEKTIKSIVVKNAKEKIEPNVKLIAGSVIKSFQAKAKEKGIRSIGSMIVPGIEILLSYDPEANSISYEIDPKVVKEIFSK